MISEFIREQKRYTLKQLCEILKCPSEKAVSIIRKLKGVGVLKAVKFSDCQKDMTELLDEHMEIADVDAAGNELLYVFTFVGVIAVGGRVLKCYPKYILHGTQPKKELKQVLKVIEKFNSKTQDILAFHESGGDRAFNLLSALLFLMNDFFENGVYTNDEKIIEINGTGEIVWDKTINETLALVSNNRPYYAALLTKRRKTDDINYFKRLHECVMTIASKQLKDADLLDLFDIEDVDMSKETLDDFGSADYILYRLEQEMHIQYNTRKRLLLSVIYAYVAHGGNLHNDGGTSFFGTKSFNNVWESVCADVLNNQLQNALSTIELPMPLKADYNGDARLIDIIDKPFWSAANMHANKTLIPDIAAAIKDDGVYIFVIFDAKYYVPRLEQGRQPESQPGVESITKQYLYQLAFQKFANDHNIKIMINCFLLPAETDEIIDKGAVYMSMFDALNLKKIQVRCVSAALMYGYYLTGRKIDVKLLNLYRSIK